MMNRPLHTVLTCSLHVLREKLQKSCQNQLKKYLLLED